MKRTVFRNRWLPYALVAPQVAITIVFFFWPAFDSLRLSLYRASPFGDRLIFIGGGDFLRLLRGPPSFPGAGTSFWVSLFFSFIRLELAPPPPPPGHTEVPGGPLSPPPDPRPYCARPG